jgi:hypothetical protein
VSIEIVLRCSTEGCGNSTTGTWDGTYRTLHRASGPGTSMDGPEYLPCPAYISVDGTFNLAEDGWREVEPESWTDQEVLCPECVDALAA